MIQRIIQFILFVAFIVSHNVVNAKELLQVFKTVMPGTVWVESSGRNPNRATVTLTVKAFGDTISTPKPIDVILVIDHSTSMIWHDDCAEPRSRMDFAHGAATAFIQTMSANDKLSILFFSGSPFNDVPSPFTSNKSTLQQKLLDKSDDGFTPLMQATNLALDHIETNGRATASKAVILLTDGAASDKQKYKDALITRIKNLTTISVYSVALGSDNVCPADNPSSAPSDTFTLKEISNASGTPFFYSKSGTDLSTIYTEIAAGLKFYAIAQLAPGAPLILDHIPTHLSFYNYQQTANNQTAIGSFSSTNNKLEWVIPQIGVDRTLEISYTISSPRSGWNNVYADSNFVTYLDAFGVKGKKYFPARRLMVAEPIRDDAISITAHAIDDRHVELTIDTSSFAKMAIETVFVYYSKNGYVDDETQAHISVPVPAIIANNGIYTVSDLAETTLYYFTVAMENFVGDKSNIITANGDTARTLVRVFEFLSEVANFPNPFQSGFNEGISNGPQKPKNFAVTYGGYITYRLNRKADVFVGVYTLSGQPVIKWEINSGQDGGNFGPNYIYWNGSNQKGRLVESGAYVLKIVAKTGDAKKKIRWKIGVLN